MQEAFYEFILNVILIVNNFPMLSKQNINNNYSNEEIIFIKFYKRSDKYTYLNSSIAFWGGINLINISFYFSLILQN